MSNEKRPGGLPKPRRMAGHRPLVSGTEVQKTPQSSRQIEILEGHRGPDHRSEAQASASLGPQRDQTGSEAATPGPPASVGQQPVAAAPVLPARKRRMGKVRPKPATTRALITRDQATDPSAIADPAIGAEPDGDAASRPEKTRMSGLSSAETRLIETAPRAQGPSPEEIASTRDGENLRPSAPLTTARARTATEADSTSSTTGAVGLGANKLRERPSWFVPTLIIAGLFGGALLVILGARWLRALEGVQEFIANYDGHSSQPTSAPEGMPWWLGWQHFFNMFLIVLIIRTGLQVRSERKPPGYWTAKKNSFFSPHSNTPKKVSLSQWLHQSLDVLWVANGLLFVVLLVATGHWLRIVPTDWDVFPNMLSAGIQYASLDWPTESGWAHYNALQVMAYFVTVFIAAPLAILSGVRLSTWWPDNAEKLNKMYPVQWARAIHFPVMLYFVLFTIVHVFLVFFTGALRNLNHMYTSRDVVDWWGVVIFLVSLVVIAAAWFLSKPLFISPIASRMGKVSK